MRLAGIEKGGYYPYPPHMADATASWFIPLPSGTRGRLLDPCAGEGEIASSLGRLLNCETWGFELFPYRTEKAAARMNVFTTRCRRGRLPSIPQLRDPLLNCACSHMQKKITGTRSCR